MTSGWQWNSEVIGGCGKRKPDATDARQSIYLPRKASRKKDRCVDIKGLVQLEIWYFISLGNTLMYLWKQSLRGGSRMGWVSTFRGNYHPIIEFILLRSDVWFEIDRTKINELGRRAIKVVTGSKRRKRWKEAKGLKRYVEEETIIRLKM
jgi:hypothetical protein